MGKESPSGDHAQDTVPLRRIASDFGQVLRAFLGQRECRLMLARLFSLDRNFNTRCEKWRERERERELHISPQRAGGKVLHLSPPKVRHIFYLSLSARESWSGAYEAYVL